MVEVMLATCTNAINESYVRNYEDGPLILTCLYPCNDTSEKLNFVSDEIMCKSMMLPNWCEHCDEKDKRNGYKVQDDIHFVKSKSTDPVDAFLKLFPTKEHTRDSQTNKER